VSGYVEAGYAVVLGTLALYSGSLLRRERRLRRRLEGAGRVLRGGAAGGEGRATSSEREAG
jgi:hypothetical protein